MPDPMAGLPPRYLRTPEAARFLGCPAARWKSTERTARARSIGRLVVALSMRSTI